MGQELPITAYALLGLLSFGDPLTGYELKQRADRTLRFYWVSPAMSQVYTELERLHRQGLVTAHGDGRATSYSLSRKGRTELTRWMEESEAGFPVLKHPVALRLLLGALVEPETVRDLLARHVKALEEEYAALAAVRESLTGSDAPDEPFRYPAMVADWGLSYFAHEKTVLEKLIEMLQDDR
jgi:DNA-binding PadR family transcriptional regulator